MKEVKINLNTHIIRVMNEEEDTTYPKYKNRPKIVYSKTEDPKAPGAFKLITDNVEELPIPIQNVLFIVNRDTIAAVRKIEIKMRKNEQYNKIFEVLKTNPNGWREIIKESGCKLSLKKKVIQKAMTFIDRHDLRAPGEQVRDSNNVVTHCTELLSEFE